MQSSPSRKNGPAKEIRSRIGTACWFGFPNPRSAKALQYPARETAGRQGRPTRKDLHGTRKGTGQGPVHLGGHPPGEQRQDRIGRGKRQPETAFLGYGAHPPGRGHCCQAGSHGRPAAAASPRIRPHPAPRRCPQDSGLPPARRPRPSLQGRPLPVRAMLEADPHRRRRLPWRASARKGAPRLGRAGCIA